MNCKFIKKEKRRNILKDHDKNKKKSFTHF